mgnify:CR=1 FL=1
MTETANILETAAPGITGVAQRNTAQFQSSVALNTRAVVFSSRIMRPTYLEVIRVSFAINTQRLLQLRFWACLSNTTRVISTGRNMPSDGRNLMAHSGPQDYTVGDGQEGEILIQRRVLLPPGSFLAVDGDNTDLLNAHTIDVAMDILELEG